MIFDNDYSTVKRIDLSPKYDEPDGVMAPDQSPLSKFWGATLLTLFCTLGAACLVWLILKVVLSIGGML